MTQQRIDRLTGEPYKPPNPMVTPRSAHPCPFCGHAIRPETSTCASCPCADHRRHWFLLFAKQRAGETYAEFLARAQS